SMWAASTSRCVSDRATPSPRCSRQVQRSHRGSCRAPRHRPSSRRRGPPCRSGTPRVSKARAVVFAYHDVGVRCLKTLLSGGIEVPLVVTVADDPHEAQWYASVAATAAEYGLQVIAPADGNSRELERMFQGLAPDFIFSFSYRAMLPAPLLAAARRGALNMHGSLLPNYRGRAPVNWAILRGERESGATLHYMVARADAGDIVDQLA